MSTPSLPPSAEAAYREKCIQLRRRQQEVEEDNDAVRLRRARLVRGIRKMRVERAILLESLSKRMQKNGAGGAVFDEESEDSTEGPPTPQERPLRTKKPHRRLPDASSPVLSSALPSAPQPQTSMSTASLAGPGSQNDPFATNGNGTDFATADLIPPPDKYSPSKLSKGTIPAMSAYDIFKDYMINGPLLQPQYRRLDQYPPTRDRHLRETWEVMPERIRQAWTSVEPAVRDAWEKAEGAKAVAAEQWKKTVGNSRARSGARATEADADEDDDVVMVGAT